MQGEPEHTSAITATVRAVETMDQSRPMWLASVEKRSMIGSAR